MSRFNGKQKYSRICISLALAFGHHSFAHANQGLKACKIAMNHGLTVTDANGGNEIVQLSISYDTQKLGGGNNQMGVYQLIAKTAALADARTKVIGLVDQQIKPAMVDILLGTTTGEKARQLIAELSTTLLIGENLKSLAAAKKISEGGALNEGSIEKMFKDLENKKTEIMSVLQGQKNSLMVIAEQTLPGAKALKALSAKFRKPKSIAEIAQEASKERDLQIDVAQKTVKLQDIADEMTTRLNAEIASVGEVGSPLLEAKMLVDGLIEYRKQLNGLATNPQYSGDAKNMERLKSVFDLLDSLITVSRQKVNESVNINLQKQTTIQAIGTLRTELESAARQYIAASKGAQVTRIESVVAKQMGDGIKAMNVQHKEILDQSTRDIKALTQTLHETESYRLDQHGAALVSQDALLALVSQVNETTLKTLEFNQTTTALIAHQVEAHDLVLALAAPGNEAQELQRLESLVNSPINEAVLSRNVESIISATIPTTNRKP
jgi:hypothetical protein